MPQGLHCSNTRARPAPGSDQRRPDDFTNYAQRLEDAWGREYRRGRYFHQLAGHPQLARAGLAALDNAVFRDRLLRALYKKARGPVHSH